MRLPGSRCSRPRTGGTRTSAPRRSIRTRTRSSISSGGRVRCTRTSVRRRTAFRTSASALPAACAGHVRFLWQRERLGHSAALSGYPIPDEAKIQANFIEGGVAGGGSSGDRHLLIVDRDRSLLYELFATRWNSTANRWEAGSGAIFDLSRNDRRTEGWTSADAAGLAILPGLVRYDEVMNGAEIRHAFRVTVRSTNGYVWPASHRAGSTGGALPMGARLRLKASKDISGYPAVHPAHLPRDEDLRAHRRRQRLGHVHHRHDGRPLEQRQLNPAFRGADGERLRGRAARVEIGRAPGAGCWVPGCWVRGMRWRWPTSE